MWSNSTDSYGWLQIILHWSTAVLVLGLIALGLYMTGLDYYDPWYHRAPEVHRAIGILTGLLVALRLVARAAQTTPRSLACSAGQRRAAGIVHGLLYALPVAMVITGYLTSTADGRAVDVFGWFEVPATLHGIPGQEDIAGDIHFALAMLLLGVIALHLAAAWHHQFMMRDDTLRRMLRPLTPSPQPDHEERP